MGTDRYKIAREKFVILEVTAGMLNILSASNTAAVKPEVVVRTSVLQQMEQKFPQIFGDF
jgi:hypothetical protein